MENETSDYNVHGATNDNVLHNMQDHAVDHEMERRLQRFLSKPVTNPGSSFNHGKPVYAGLPCVTDWNDTEIGPRKCYNLFKMKKDRDIVALGDARTNVNSRAICKLMLLAYQLADDHGNECFGDVPRDLVCEKVEFDDVISDYTLRISRNPSY